METEYKQAVRVAIQYTMHPPLWGRRHNTANIAPYRCIRNNEHKYSLICAVCMPIYIVKIHIHSRDFKS